MDIEPNAEDGSTTDPLKKTATLIYILQGLSLLLVITFVIGLVIAYIKKDEAKGTWVASHFKWQIRTFWWYLAWAILGVLTVGLGIGVFILIANGLWFIYRIIKGYLALTKSAVMYA